MRFPSQAFPLRFCSTHACGWMDKPNLIPCLMDVTFGATVAKATSN